MRRIIFVVLVIFAISSAFSYVYSPRIVSGNFEVQAEYSNLKKFDLVMLMNPNWNITYIKIEGDKPVDTYVGIKNVYGNTYLALHFKYENVSYTRIKVGINPKENGEIKIYEVFEEKFKRVIIPIKYADYSYIIPIIIGSLPLLTFIAVKRGKR